jgi:hypothetical protein
VPFNFHNARLWIVETQDQGKDRALARTAGTHERIFFSGLDAKRGVTKGEFFGAVAKTHIFKFDQTLAALQRLGGG